MEEACEWQPLKVSHWLLSSIELSLKHGDHHLIVFSKIAPLLVKSQENNPVIIVLRIFESFQMVFQGKIIDLIQPQHRVDALNTRHR